jgi:hypothetical protein
MSADAEGRSNGGHRTGWVGLISASAPAALLNGGTAAGSALVLLDTIIGS